MAHDAQVCRSCGNLVSECSDPDRDWHPQTVTCYASASIEWGKRRLAEKCQGVEVDGGSLHPLDGIGVYVTQEAPPEGEDPFA